MKKNEGIFWVKSWEFENIKLKKNGSLMLKSNKNCTVKTNDRIHLSKSLCCSKFFEYINN